MGKKGGFVFLFILFFLFIQTSVLKANSVTTTFKMEEKAIDLGKKFRVRLVIESQDTFHKMEGYISYDENMIQYVSAEDGISGGRGKLKISLDDLEESQYVEEYEDDYGVEVENPKAELTKKTFEIVFKAIKSGKTSLSFVDGVKIHGEKGKEMSFSSNSLEIRVKNKREASGISSLSFLEVEEAALKPAFSRSIFQYEVQVGEEVEKLNIKALPTDENAKITVAGNGKFKEGKNLVKVIVTSEGGFESNYEILVDRKKQGIVKEEKEKERNPEKIEEKAEKSLEKEKEKFQEKGDEKEDEGSLGEYEEISEKEEGTEKEKVDRKKTMFYGIMTAVVVIALIGLKLVWGKLKKLEEEK